ncbi:DUF1565 domain-containing protein [Dyella subtropica]|uniref:DUF1565 domain-containing protein n=1 Tax=Dyella subtropica TaxID=2992127 RepID=UPI0022583BCC|nr:right-handed parallel beta-helix repeat-containing protein [Dyella subtropica]
MKTLPMFRMAAIAAVISSALLGARPAAADVGISVSPAQVSLPANGTQQFVANVSGSSNSNVTWLVNGVPGGAPSLGTISPTGVYTAPAGASSNFTATISAASVASPTSTGAASAAVAAATYIGPTYYVATNGNDGNDGSAANPWASIQWAVDHVPAGATVQVAGGTYNKLVTMTQSGSATAGFITLMSAPGQTAIIDGTGLGIASGTQGLLNLSNVSYVRVIGLELRNYTSNSISQTPAGIYVQGTGDHIEIRNNHIHHIATTITTSDGDAFGLAVYGTAITPISQLIIDGNTLDSLTLGYSESLSVNGNVQNWQVTNNEVHDNNNIGIVAIGFEGTAPSTSLDQARNGWIANNNVYNITSSTNPAYNYQPSADGIYVDGGTQITIEQNTVQAADLGIELASEHYGRTTSYITARNNIVFNSNVVGMSIGGYAASVGGTTHCNIVNNTLYENDTNSSGSGELQIQYNASSNLVANNILYANDQGLLVSSPYTYSTPPATLQNNLYFSSAGSSGASWIWNGSTYITLSTFQQASGSETHGVLADPLFVNAAALNLRLAAGSPGILQGLNLGLVVEGAYDYAGAARTTTSGLIDQGAYQH